VLHNHPALHDRFIELNDAVKNCDYPTSPDHNAQYIRFISSEITNLRRILWKPRSPYEFLPLCVDFVKIKLKKRTVKSVSKRAAAFVMKNYPDIYSRFPDLKELVTTSFKTEMSFLEEYFYLLFLSRKIVELIEIINNQEIEIS
jgi:hypothetical protein